MISFVPAIITTVLQFVLGAIWYSVLFGKQWQDIMEFDKKSKKEIEIAMQGMGYFYALQFAITLITNVVLSIFITSTTMPIMSVALLVWFGFVLPSQISSVVWANTRRSVQLKQIVIMASNQLASVLIAALVFSFWK